MVAGRVRSLSQRYTLVLAAVALPLLLLIVGLSVYRFQVQRAHEFAALERGLADQKAALDVVVKVAQDHVQRLHHQAEDRLAGRSAAAPSPLRAHLRPEQVQGTDGQTINALSLNSIVGTPLEGRSGNFIAIPELASTRGEEIVEVDMALELMEPMRLEKEVTPFLQWSYYFSAARDFVTVEPFVPASDLVKEGSYSSVADQIDSWLHYDIFLLGTPERNPQRSSYWTPVYLDAAGAGWMISHGAPVYRGGRFMGIIGTDIVLSFFDAFLGKLAPSAGRVWIVNEFGDILADSHGNAPSGDSVPKLAEVLPATLGGLELSQLLGSSYAFRPVGNGYAAARTMAATPWTLLQFVEQREVNALVFSQLAPYGFILAGLLATLVVAHVLLRRQFIAPAIALVDQLSAESAERRTTPPSLPAIWRPWLELISATFAERRAHLAHLEASEQRFRTIAEAHPTPMIIVRLEDRQVLFANRAYLDMFRLPVDCLAREAGGALCFEEQDWLYETVARGEAVLNRELELERGGGTRFTASVTAQRIVYEGAPAMVAGAIDLTPLKAAEAEIARQREALHQGEKLAALGSLLAGVAHELNNPLSVVLGYSALLRDHASHRSATQWAERIHAAADRCNRIVKTFLAMARQKPQSRGAVDLNETLRATVEMLGYQLRTADVEVIWQLAAELPTVQGDSDQLNQIFINLIVNAQQALQEQPVPRRLQLTTRQDGDNLLVEVADNGPGIPQAQRSRIFEPFFTTKSVGVGTGLGLSVSRSIALAHGGELALAEPAGGGARFRLRLPLVAAAEATESPGQPAPEARPCAILVVDDEPDIRDLLVEVLGRDGHAVSVAGSGREAIARLEAEHFDLILSDLRMPDLDGPALYSYLKGKRPDLQPRIVFMTGDLLSADIKAFLANVTVPVLEKPLDLDLVRRQVSMPKMAAAADLDT